MSKPVDDCTISTTDSDGSLYTVRLSGGDIEVRRRGETWTGSIVYSGERMIGVEWSEEEGETEPDAAEIDMVEQIITDEA